MAVDKALNYLKCTGYQIRSRRYDSVATSIVPGVKPDIPQINYLVCEEQVREININKDDIIHVFGYNAARENTAGVPPEVFWKVSNRIGLVLKNQDIIELQIVGRAPYVEVDGPDAGKGEGLQVASTNNYNRQGLHVYTEPFVGIDYSTGGGGTSNLSTNLDWNGFYEMDDKWPTDGCSASPAGRAQTQWSGNAIMQYLKGIGYIGDVYPSFDAASSTQVAQTVNSWLVSLIEEQLLANPGGKLQDITLPTVPDFRTTGIGEGEELTCSWYHGFELKFGGLSAGYIVDWVVPELDPDYTPFARYSVQWSSYPFRYLTQTPTTEESALPDPKFG